MDILWPPFETPSLAHPFRLQAERAFGLGKFRKIIHRAEGPIGACRVTVANAVLQNGGSPVSGWHIHVWPNLFFEALAHYVWRPPGGALIDLTCKYPSDRSHHSVFIPSRDPAFGDSLHSRYFILNQAPEVHVLIDAARKRAENRQRIERNVRLRLGSGARKAYPLLGQANDEEMYVLANDERWVGVAIRACQDLCARKYPGLRPPNWNTPTATGMRPSSKS